MKNNKSYSDFFQQATGNEPFPYQEAFQQRAVTPIANLEAPTGAEKTETIVCDGCMLFCRINPTPQAGKR